MTEIAEMLDGLLMLNYKDKKLMIIENGIITFVPMTNKDIVMACKYFDLINNTEKESELKTVKKYFYDKGRYIKTKYADNEKYPILINSK